MAMIETDRRNSRPATSRPAITASDGARGPLAGQLPTVVWMTGRSGAGKSTISEIVAQRLRARGCGVATVDGDHLRSGLCRDLGFSAEDRAENVRRAGYLANLMSKAGLIVIVSLISPFRSGRAAVRELFEPGDFIEVYVDASLEVAEWRDPKGLYRRARRGEIKQFTGIDSPYEPPQSAELHIDTLAGDPEQCAEQVISALKDAGRITN